MKVVRPYITYTAWALRCRSVALGNARAFNYGTATGKVPTLFLSSTPNLETAPAGIRAANNEATTKHLSGLSPWVVRLAAMCVTLLARSK